MNRLFRPGLFVQLTLATFAVVAVAFLLNAGFSILAGRQPLQELVAENLSYQTRAVYQGVEKYLGHCGQEIELWSTLDTLDDVLILDRSLRIENLLLGLQREHSGNFSLLSVLDRTGRVLASTDLATIGSSMSLDDLDEPEEGWLRFGRLPSLFNEDGTTLILAHPIISRLDSEPIGWLVAHVNWNPIERLVSAARVTSTESSPERFFVLLDDENRVIAGDYRNLRDVPADWVGRLTDEDLSTMSLGAAGTYLVARHARRTSGSTTMPELRTVGLWKRIEAHRVVRSFALAVIGSASLGLLLAAGASFAIARPLTRRIEKLTEGTEKLARGELGHRVVEGRDDELGRLARSFNRMASRLTRSRNEVKQGAARWEALVQQAPDIIMTVSKEGRILFINRAIPGRTVKKMTGSSVYDYLPSAYHAATRRILSCVARTGHSTSREIELLGEHDEPIWFSTRIGPIRKGETIVALTIIASDITEHRRLEQDILAVSELERQRFGQDLHDGLGQTLTGASLLTRSLEQRLDDELPDASAEARRILEVVNGAIEQSRRLARGLYPVELDDGGLSGALDELALAVNGLRGVRCRFSRDDGAAPIDRATALQLFRITQEAINNSLRHGKAGTIVIELTGRSDHGRLRIEDDGIGVPRESELVPGIGLRLMRYRASIIGGTLQIHRRRRGGTVIECRF